MARKKKILKTVDEIPTAKIDPTVIIFRIGKKEVSHIVMPTIKMAKEMIKRKDKKYKAEILTQTEYFKKQKRNEFQMR